MSKHTDHSPTILIGRDTRISGTLIESAMTAGFLSYGANVKQLGVIPTPGVAYLTKRLKADASVVISASHNSFEFNGIKFFNNKGYTTSSMHDYTESYYFRSKIHANMGSGVYYGVEDLGLDYTWEYKEWPSDEEFINVALDIILNDNNDKPFMTWLTTVTAHQPYGVSSEYGDLYLDVFFK